MILSCSTVYYIPDFGIDYQRYVDSISILDFVVLVLDILDFADSMNLNFYMDTSFDLVFCSLLKNYSYTNRSNLKLTFELVLVYTSFLLLKISFPLIIYKSRRPSYNHDHWIRVDSHWRSSIRILLVDCDNYARMLWNYDKGKIWCHELIPFVICLVVICTVIYSSITLMSKISFWAFTSQPLFPTFWIFLYFRSTMSAIIWNIILWWGEVLESRNTWVMWR